MDTVFVLSTAKHGKFVNKINEKIFELITVLNLIQECFIKAIEAEKLSSA